ncbi:hypothetical protein [Mucilaginibacter gotjawali]|uniref:Uncharacterized protein n=2 Tax=Mucilaginibacter gotjawali TaxID=1550579 RepID=A0A839SRM1_9SPHI|nr:hypothetical protein [Mucilaginibacter gotjawali]MBB3059129.1 hypothetical protein [Mucilaginibacter gotjawali]BAU52219.1 hypothetical protein MgSA37_00369 [Mucilaginibacter gotjawali]
MDIPVRNIDDLRNEISRLKGVEQEQSIALSQRFRSPGAILSSIISIFHTPANADGHKENGFFDQDIVSLISRFVLPFTLNKTVFRNSGFIIKTLVGLVSQKASNFITEDMVVSLWDKAKSLFKSKIPQVTPAHKGVPPLSETY